MIISIFKSVMDVSNPYQREIAIAFKRIKEGASKDQINRYRLTKLDADKRALPGYCFNGQFKTREIKGLIQPSGLMTLDFDKFETIEQAKQYKEELRENPFIYAAFISPSGLGVKALAKVPKDPDNFRLYYNAIEKYFDTIHFDKSGKDISRFCFESYDPGLWINESATEWTEKEEEDIGAIGKEKVAVPIKSENSIIRNLQSWFEKKYPMVKGERNNNLLKLARALNDFGIIKQTAIDVCQEYQTSDFSAKEIEQIVNSAYKAGAAKFGTQFFEDKKTYTEIEKQIRTGKTEKSISQDLGVEKKTVEAVKSKLAELKEFWQHTQNGKISLSPHNFKFWLEQNNFLKFYPSDGNTFTFIRKEQNFIEETNEKLIKDFVLEELLKMENIGFAPYDLMAGNVRYFTPQFLSMLSSAEIKLKEDTSEAAYLYYRNCAVEVKQSGIKEIDYLNLDGYVWKNQIIDRDFKKVDHHPSEFRTFIWRVSGEDVQRYNALKSVIGYLLHSYKTSANNRAIILNDETISENPNGGSGKGLFWNAISKMKKVSMIDGKTFEFTKSFPYQTVSTDCQVLVFDDVKKNFNFESLFSLITEGITLEYKGQDAIKLPIQKSPKILITTNYTVGGVGGSFERRKFEVEFSAHFGAHYTPLEEFGHLLFDDWSEDEWVRFDSYMINCLQFYLQNGLVQHEFQNLEVRKLIKETSFEFYEWAKERITFNERLYKSTLFDDFVSEYQDYKKWLSQKRFTQWLTTYGKHIKVDFRENKDISGRYIEFNKDQEHENNPFEEPF